MSVQRTSSNLLFVGVLGAIVGVYLLGQLILNRSHGRRAVPEQVAELLDQGVAPPESSSGNPTPAKAQGSADKAPQAASSTGASSSRVEPSPATAKEAPKRRWEIAGQVFLPPTSPVDATLRLVALPAPPATLFEPWNPPDWNDHGEGDQAEAKVAADGSFRLILPVHWERAFLDLSGRYLYFDEPLEVIQDARTAGVPLFLRPRLGAWVRGRIYGSRGEQLVASFVRRTRVSAVPDLDALRDALAQGGLDTLVNERLSARPNDEGVFELRGVPPLTTFLVAPVAEGLLPGRATSVHAQPGAELDLEFEMAPGRTVRGKLVDPEGRPLRGARVSYRGDLELDGFAPLFGPWAVVDGTDESGLFELKGLPERAELALECELPGWILHTPLVVDTTVPESSPASSPEANPEVSTEVRPEVAEASTDPGPLLRAVLHRGNVLQGRVAWADGSPAPGFHVRLERRSREFLALESDADGRFRAIGLSDEPFSVVASGVEKLAPTRSRVGWQRLVDVDPLTSELQITLGQGAPLEGLVRTVGGERVLDYELVVMPLDVEGGPDGFRAHFEGAGLDPDRTVPPPLANRASKGPGSKEVQPPNGPPSTAGTAPSADAPVGGFRLEGLQHGSWSVTLQAPGYVEPKPRIVRLPRTATAEQLPFELVATGSAYGAILDPEGQRVAGARLRTLVSWQDKEGNARTGSGMASDEWRSDAYGRFRVEGLSPGTHRWIASAPGFASSRMVEVLVPAGGRVEAIQIALRRGGLLTGKLLDVHDEPLAGRFISVARADFLDARTGRTDDRGGFAFKDLEPGKWRVYALPENAAGGREAPQEQLALSSEVVIREGDESRVVLGGRPAPEILVSHLYGTVVDQDGEPTPGVLVSLGESGALSMTAPYGSRLLQTKSDREGRFRFEALPLRTYDLCAFPPDRSRLAPRVLRGITLDENSHDVEEVGVELEPGGALAGRVLDAAGTPIAGASIFVREAQGFVLARISELTSDAEGRFLYPALAPGRYTILARTEDGSTEESEALLVRAGEQVATEITLHPGTLLSVQLQSEEGAAHLARVLVLDDQGRRVNGLVGMETFLREIESGFSDHEQTVGPLAPGLYHVSATLEDGRMVEEDIQLSGAPAERVILRVE